MSIVIIIVLLLLVGCYHQYTALGFVAAKMEWAEADTELRKQVEWSMDQKETADQAKICLELSNRCDHLSKRKSILRILMLGLALALLYNILLHH